MTQRTLTDAGPSPPRPAIGSCTCGGKGWLTLEGTSWPVRCIGCNWVSQRHKRLAKRLQEHEASLAKLGGPPTEKQKAMARKIHERAMHEDERSLLAKAIEQEIENPLTECECSRSRCCCKDEDDV